MMGAQLTNQVLAKWAPHISDRAFRILIRMAATALDSDSGSKPGGMYFGGADLLAMTLHARRGGTDDTAHRIVRLAVSELISVGAIERLEEARRGRRAVYRLTLDAGIQVPESRNTGSGVNTVSGIQVPNSDSSGSPLGTTGTTTSNELPEDEVVPFPTDVQAAREDSAANDFLPVDGKRTNACPECDTYLDPDGSCFVCRRQMQMEAS